MKRLYLHVSGVVQGVGFRWHTQQQAIKLGLAGFVRNTDHNTVEVEIQGNEAVLESFITWSYTGVPRAVVEKIDVTEIPLVKSDQVFHIKPSRM